MKLTIKHHHDFGTNAALAGESLIAPGAWDRLRVSIADDAFRVPQDRKGWIAVCQNAQVEAMASDLSRVIEAAGLPPVVSVGVGKAALEYYLKRKLPSLNLTCAEHSPEVVQRLRSVFTECDAVESFDMRSAHWPYAGSLCLLSRVETELTDAEWRTAFTNMRQSGIRQVLMVSSGFVTPLSAARELAHRVIARVKGRRATFAGYLRSEAAFRALWGGEWAIAEEHQVGGLKAYLLTVR